MNDDLSCSVVKDLLPIYLDGLACEETSAYLEKHLNECTLCLKEYKKLQEITEDNKKEFVDEASLIRTLKRRLATSFIAVVLVSILLISIAMFCFYNKSFYSEPKVFDIISLLVIYIGMYFLPLLAMVVSILWRKTINKEASTFWPNVIISLLAICILVEVLLLLWRFFTVARGY